MAILRGNLPAPVGVRLLENKVIAVPKAINGTDRLPNPIVRIKEGIDNVLAHCWEENFMKDKNKKRKK